MNGDAPGSVGFAGRVGELRMMSDAMGAAERGDGAVVVVAGDAGIGKTRFCREVAIRASGREFVVAWGTCWPDGGAPPLWPWQAILRELGDATAADLLVDDRGGSAVEPERFARFTAVVDRLAEACAKAPLLVVIDDAHLADTGALLLTRFVARRVVRLPIVLLLARRPGESDTPPHLDIASDATPVNLTSFNLAETAHFLRAHGHAEIEEDLLLVLLRLTDGHPLHLQRVAAAGFDPVGGHGGGHGGGGVRAEIARAVDRLSGSTRAILSRAAVLGSSPLVAEAAAVSAAPRAAVWDAIEESVQTGLIAREDDGQQRFSYGHELVRETFHALLSGAERQAAHARAAATIVPTGPGDSTRLARRANHALRAAPRSTADAQTAVTACREAARAMIAGFDYERACALLASAAAAYEPAGLTDPVAKLLVEWAEATLLCGRLAQARPLFERAVSAAREERDAVSLAKATLGLGGVWVNEHRTHIDWERMIGLQRRALAGLDDSEPGLRQRLLVRLAVEKVYRGGPVEPVLAVLDDARRLGDGKVLAEALSLVHHAMLTARHTHARLALADELIAVAAPAGEGFLALIGLCWRTVDLFHLGDPRAPRVLADLRERAATLGCLSVLFIVAAMEVMLLVRAGRLADAEERAQSCFALGTEAGDADALGYLGVHLTTIRWLQGRDPEMLETVEGIADSPTLNPAEFGFQATVAMLAARSGQPDKARVLLDRLAEPGLATLPDSSTWLAGMLAIAEAAYLLGDAGRAREVYDLVEPFADLPIMPSLAVTCFGSARRVLGLAALTAGDVDDGVTHLEQALTANRRLGNRPVTAVTMADLATAYLRRGRDGDRERASTLLANAVDEAKAMDMAAHAETWSRRLHELTVHIGTIDRHDQRWTLTMGHRQATVSNRRGVRYLARLLTNPGRPITALQLASEQGDTVVAAPAQPVLDDRAKAQYRARVRELTAAIERADDRADRERADRLRAELDALVEELRRVTGKGGRTRAFADPGERARTAVRQAIKRAIDEIAEQEPTIAAYLRDTIVTGATCCFTPDNSPPVRWTSTSP
ncbi:AAA family ATPase [Actinomycetes bacterium KLBMP 9797]